MFTQQFILIVLTWLISTCQGIKTEQIKKIIYVINISYFCVKTLCCTQNAIINLII